MAAKIDGVTKAIKALEAKMQEKVELEEGILREGKKIVIPERMSLLEAAKALTIYHERMETTEVTHLYLDSHPHDTLVNFYRAISDTFGQLLPGERVENFWGGESGGDQVTIPISYNETTTVPIGDVSLPGLPVYMDIGVSMPGRDSDHWGSAHIEIRHQRKYRPLVKEIEAITKERLRTNSIFRGKAIDSQFNFLDLSGVDENRVIYSENERWCLDTDIWTPIRASDRCRNRGVSLRRGILLHGPFGTGKTLTARLTAKIAVENGWTFINVKPGDSIIRPLSFAKINQPAVVFFEDVDTIVGEERDEDVNSVLNVIDGLVSKDAEIITILTTNYVDRISKAMLRPGRLDSVIRLGELDEQALEHLILAHTGDCFDGKLDIEDAFGAAAGYPPAFVVGAANKAMLRAITRTNGSCGNPIVTSDDVISALKGLRSQFDLMCAAQAVPMPKLDQVFGAMVRDAVKEAM